MKGKEGVKRITISLPTNLLQVLDEFCKKNHGLKRSNAIAEAIKRLGEEKV